MFELYQTPLDILYFVLTIVIALVGLFLALALYQFIRMLSDVRRITERARDTLDLVNHYLWQPIKIIMMLIEKGKQYAGKKKKASD